MALTNNGLGWIQEIAASSSANISGTTVSGDKNIHVKGLLIHNTSTSDSQNIKLGGTGL